MTGIVRFAVDHWRMTIALLAFAIIGGFLAMFSITLEAEPDVPVPFVFVEVVLPGVSPEDSERLLVKPLETELKLLDGVKELQGFGYSSVGTVIIEFDADFDQDAAVSDVIEAVNRARGELPEEAKEPRVTEISLATQPLIAVNLFGVVPDRELQLRAKQLKERFESNSKILRAEILGEREELLEAVINPALMDSNNITFNELAAAISRNNSLVPAGRLNTGSGDFSVKLPGQIEQPQDLADIVVRTGPDGSILRLSDIAEVRSSFKDRRAYARFQGRPSVTLEISKRTGENILDTVAEIRAMLADETADWPENIQMEFSQDQTIYIFELIGSLFQAIVNAVVLVAIVCIAALGVRSALMVGFVIPGSFLITLFLFAALDRPVNMMVMFAMVLSVGILVDSAVVVVEYADRKLAEGMERREAYILAGERMFWPIVSSTGTTLAAFLPLLFWNTISGQFMSHFPRTLIFILSASMVMALIFLPMIGALFGPKQIKNASESLRSLSAAEGDPLSLSGFTGGYARFIDRLARFPTLVLIATILIVLGVFTLFSSSQHRVEFFTDEGGEEIYVYARARGNAPPQAYNEVAIEIERRLQDIEGVQSTLTVSGQLARSDGVRGGNPPVDMVARTSLELLPFEVRKASVEIERDVIAALADFPGVTFETEIETDGPPTGKDVTIELTSENLDALRETTERLTAHFKTMPSLIAVENTLPLPGVEWQLEIDKAEAGRLGVDIQAIGAAVQFVTDGALVGFFRPLDTDDEIDIRLRFPEAARGLSSLDDLRIQTRNGSVPLSSVVKRTAKPKLESIERRDQNRFYEVRANTNSGIDPATGERYATNLIVGDIKTWLTEEFELPDGVNFRFLGQEEENAAAGRFFARAGLATLFMMAVILLWQFNNFWHVLMTLSAVVLSITGVLLGLQFYHYISILLCGTGVLALAGIVVNNNIVLIDTFQRLSAQGFSPHEAAVRTAAQRMRPVFLTTVTTVAGLMPMVLEIQANLVTGVFSTGGSVSSSVWAPVSYVIVCGLAFATVLTLIFTPIMLAAPAKWGASTRGLWSWIQSWADWLFSFLAPHLPRRPKFLRKSGDEEEAESAAQ